MSGGKDSTGGGCWGRKVPQTQRRTQRKNDALVTCTVKLVLNQSSEEPCNALDSGAPEGPVWKRERCRWVPKVSDGPTPEQFFDYNLARHWPAKGNRLFSFGSQNGAGYGGRTGCVG